MDWNPIALFQRLSTPMKIAVGAAVVGIAIFAYIQFKKGQSSAATSSDVTSAGSGATTISQLLTALGVDGSTTAADTSGGNVVAATAAATPANNASIPSAVAPSPSSNAPTPKPSTTARYVTVVPWAPGSTSDSTLGNIASNEHVQGGLAALLKLNPSISNPNVVTPGERIRVA
jgi:hypothetical protein